MGHTEHTTRNASLAIMEVAQRYLREAGYGILSLGVFRNFLSSRERLVESEKIFAIYLRPHLVSHPVKLSRLVIVLVVVQRFQFGNSLLSREVAVSASGQVIVHATEIRVYHHLSILVDVEVLVVNQCIVPFLAQGLENHVRLRGCRHPLPRL